MRQKERCSGKSDGQTIFHMKNNDYLWEEIICRNCCDLFGPFLKMSPLRTNKNQGGYQQGCDESQLTEFEQINNLSRKN